ncbi:MAG TPA: hypothetical protein VGG64_28235 [Pirellulales bacterium]
MKLEPPSERFINRLTLACGLLMVPFSILVLLTESFTWDRVLLLFGGLVVIAQSTASLLRLRNQ